MNGRAPRWLIACSVVLGCAAVALQHARSAAAARDVAGVEQGASVSPLLPFAARCKARGEAARLHAAALEQLAVARWQRVPFALDQAPRATQQIAEAEACYRAAGDRERAARAATLHRRYESLTVQRFAAARLRLRGAPAAQPAEGTRAALATLLALLDGAREDALDYRAQLERMALAYNEESAP